MSEERAKRIPWRNFITIPEVAEAKGVTRVAVLYAIRSGRLRASRAPGCRSWFIYIDDARAYIDAPTRRVAV